MTRGIMRTRGRSLTLRKWRTSWWGSCAGRRALAKPDLHGTAARRLCRLTTCCASKMLNLKCCWQPQVCSQKVHCFCAHYLWWRYVACSSLTDSRLAAHAFLPCPMPGRASKFASLDGFSYKVLPVLWQNFVVSPFALLKLPFACLCFSGIKRCIAAQVTSRTLHCAQAWTQGMST